MFIQVSQKWDDGTICPQFLNLKHVTRIALEPREDKKGEDVVVYLFDPNEGEMCIKLATPFNLVGSKLLESGILIKP